VVRASAPTVTAIDDDAWQQARDPAARSARLPLVAVEAAREALAAGAPVLVQVPRGGYVPALACARCRSKARCRRCAGPLALPAGELAAGDPRLPACRWCGAVERTFVCPACGSRRLRAVVVGAARTAEELGRAFPGVPVRPSGGSASAGGPDAGVLPSVPARRALVVCTPGAEPVADGGYGAALLLDGWTLLARPDLRASEEALRRWLTAAALVRPASSGGRVVVVADSALPPVQALIRWDPAWHAAAELAARTELGFPPAVRMAALDGTPAAIAELLEAARLPPTAELLGPVPAGDGDRMIVRVPRSDGRALAASLAAAQAVRVARKAADPVRIQLDAAP
jgi:primosomal protein N' (replication factor Y) (superfamily II helicase)